LKDSNPCEFETNMMSPPRIRALATALLFIAPWLVGFLALVVYPFFASLAWSFDRYDMLSPPEYVGGANYQRLAEELAGGQRFGQAIWNTAYYALVSVPLSIALGVGLAVMLSWNVRGRAVYRTIFFFPRWCRPSPARSCGCGCSIRRPAWSTTFCRWPDCPRPAGSTARPRRPSCRFGFQATAALDPRTPWC
jgi:hypothetical protein